MGLGIGCIKAVHIGQEDVHIGVHDARDESGQIVIVPDLEFIDGHDVVLIDHGDHTPLDEPLECIARVGVMMPVQRIRTGQEYLCHRLAVFGKEPLIDMHEDALAHSRAGLFARDIPRFFGKLQFSHTDGTRSGRNQDHLLSLVLQIRHHAGQFFDFLIIDLAIGIRDRAGPDLDDDAPGFRQPFPFHSFHRLFLCPAPGLTAGSGKTMLQACGLLRAFPHRFPAD